MPYILLTGPPFVSIFFFNLGTKHSSSLNSYAGLSDFLPWILGLGFCWFCFCICLGFFDCFLFSILFSFLIFLFKRKGIQESPYASIKLYDSKQIAPVQTDCCAKTKWNLRSVKLVTCLLEASCIPDTILY